MADEVPLPPSVESMIRRICIDQCQSPPDTSIRRRLSGLGEEKSLQILTTISTEKIHKTLSAFIVYLAKGYSSVPTQQSVNQSPQKWSSSTCSTPVNFPNGVNSHSQISKRLIFSPSSSSEMPRTHFFSPQLLALSELEFRKQFLILNYIGSNKLEDLSAGYILSLKDLPMRSFEINVWDAFGRRDQTDRCKYPDWDSGKTHLFHCHVYQDGSCTFKGPYLTTTRTHLQRELGDDNVLIVKFADGATGSTNTMTGSSNYGAAFDRIAKKGILVALRHYRFFAFKDGGKEEKKKSPTSSPVKCYFVRMESLSPFDEREPYILSNKTVYEARRLFMHIHMVSSMAKYMARFSLVLSKTIKLQVNLASVHIDKIEDIPCHDANGCIVNNEDGERLIHTDGTGYISENLALKTPRDFSQAKYISEEKFERCLRHVSCEEKSLEQGLEAHLREPPLLMQIRLFNNGCAVKGTLLVNRTLPPSTIQIRHSMIKVENDPELSNVQTFNSLEIVAISNKPRRSFLSKYLIALLSYGGVPKEYFLEILTNALEDARSVYSSKRAALRVGLNNSEIDDDYTVARMILSGVPLNEPFLQYRLSVLAKAERKRLQGGKIPISESYYLMGTADPTGVLNSDEVCVILDNGQISGKVLVYRNPGLHFGDIHVLKAVYMRDLEEVVGNAKYGIFFSIKGQRSVGNEIAGGDFDGDMYWVSRNPQLLKYFKASKPWSRKYSTPKMPQIKPRELSAEQLEHELFQLFKRTRFQPSSNMSTAADSWLAYMDRLLILGDDSSNEKEKERMKEAMQQLIDLYYDALDAPKSGNKVVIPNKLRVQKYPHFMERASTYYSTSVLGRIYETVKSFQSEDFSTNGVEIWKLPCFDIEIPGPCLKLWNERHCNYRKEMRDALNSNNETKNDGANAVIKRYKQLLYDAAEFEESARTIEDIYNEALAIYHVTYDYAKSRKDVSRCNFAWKVAGPALVKLYALKQSEKHIVCSTSVLREVLN